MERVGTSIQGHPLHEIGIRLELDAKKKIRRRQGGKVHERM